ncbi:S-adenosyl-L-methionine-dependent methyltransferase [Phytophthora cactorum]|nr:S-adenosyl-L-methionine-dependent methyltransferase [Phytophthora cactorum]
MALVTEVRLRCLKTHEPGKGKKNKKNKRRRLTNGDAVEDGEDACADMYRAAQAQLEQEMKAAGMEGTLPMSFGGGASKKRKRPVEEEVEQFPDEEENGQVDGEEGNNAVDADLAEGEGGDGIIADGEEQVAGKETPKTETTIVDKIRVVYDSDGEVVERVVEKVEVVEEVKPQEQSIGEIEHKNSTGKKKKNKYPGRSSCLLRDGFFVLTVCFLWLYCSPKGRRQVLPAKACLFEKFEDGIQLDHESWYSVTPQVIAEHLAKRLACDVVVDPFSGCGGNVIQLAMTCKQVIAIDIDPEKIRMAKHNAGIYGVADKIEFIVGNSIDILPRLKADAVFLSPPWGGVKYSRKRFSLEDMLVKGVSGLDLFAKARQVSKNIAYYLPRGTPTEDLEALTPGEPVECEKIFLNKQLKVVTAYYGDLVASEKQVEDPATSNGQKQE